jgi:hypothetical protein
LESTVKELAMINVSRPNMRTKMQDPETGLYFLYNEVAILCFTNMTFMNIHVVVCWWHDMHNKEVGVHYIEIDTLDT